MSQLEDTFGIDIDRLGELFGKLDPAADAARKAASTLKAAKTRKQDIGRYATDYAERIKKADASVKRAQEKRDELLAAFNALVAEYTALYDASLALLPPERQDYVAANHPHTGMFYPTRSYTDSVTVPGYMTIYRALNWSPREVEAIPVGYVAFYVQYRPTGRSMLWSIYPAYAYEVVEPERYGDLGLTADATAKYEGHASALTDSRQAEDWPKVRVTYKVVRYGQRIDTN